MFTPLLLLYYKATKNREQLSLIYRTMGFVFLKDNRKPLTSSFEFPKKSRWQSAVRELDFVF